MAQHALPSGRTTRRRAMFGLLDADGWSWASVKAAFWFVVIIFMLGYIPDRAYYFTVFSTIDLGILAWSPVNLCPATNEDLPCPVPLGAALPWHPSPNELRLPEPRMDGSAVQVGKKLLYVGGSPDGKTASEKVFVAETVGTGNFAQWQAGPALPAPRADAAVLFFNGSVYALGGRDETGKPTNTAFILTPDTTTGDLKTWQSAKDAGLELDLPEARAGAAVVPVQDGLVVVGGTGPNGATKTVWKATTDPTSGKLGAWQEQAPLYAERSDAAAAQVGDYIWVYGGAGADGKPVAQIERGHVTKEGGQPAAVSQWSVAAGNVNLPAARTNASGFNANGALYLVGGDDGSGSKSETYWSVPTANGVIPEWHHLAESDLPPGGLQGAAPVVLGPNAILIGGQSAQAGVLDSSARSNLAPQPPFFQAGILGLTVPALKIEGEIGQQLGYLNAAGAGTVNFIILLLIGWAFAHKERTRAIVERIRRRRHR